MPCSSKALVTLSTSEGFHATVTLHASIEISQGSKAFVTLGTSHCVSSCDVLNSLPD